MSAPAATETPPGPELRDKARRFGPWVVLALAAWVRAAAYAEWKAWPGSAVAVLDAGWHLAWGARIAAGDWLGGAGTWVVAPGLAYFDAVAAGLLGAGTHGAALAMLAVDLLVVEGVRRIGERLGGAEIGPEIGLVAGLAAALSGPLAFHAVTLVGTSPPMALLCGAMLLALGPEGRLPKLGALVGAGLLVGLSVYFRPNHLVLLPVLALAAAWRTGVSRGELARRAGAMILGLILGLTPGVLRNGLVGGDWVPTSANAGSNLYMAQEPGSFTYESAPPPGPVNLESMSARFQAEAETAAGHPLSAGEADAWWMAKAKARIRQDPWGFVARTAGRTYVALATWGVHDHYDWPVWRRDRPFWGRLPDTSLLLPGLGLVGGLLLWRSGRRREVVVAGALVLGVALSLSPFTIVERYRISEQVGLLPLAAAGLILGLRKPQFLALAVAVSLLMSLDPFHVRLVLPDSLAFGPATSWTAQSGLSREAGEASNIAAAFVRAGQADQALPFLERAVRLEPGRLDDQVSLAGILIQQKIYEPAFTKLNQVLRMDPTHADAAMTACSALLGAGSRDALSACALATKNAPERGEAWFQLGLARWGAGDLAGAEEALGQGLRINPMLPRGQEALDKLRSQRAATPPDPG